MKPSTIIDVIKFQLCAGNKREQENAGNSIETQEDLQHAEARRNLELGENPKNRRWKETWIDEINDLMWKRKIIFEKEKKQKFYDTNNKRIIEYVIDYVV